MSGVGSSNKSPHKILRDDFKSKIIQITTNITGLNLKNQNFEILMLVFFFYYVIMENK